MFSAAFLRPLQSVFQLIRALLFSSVEKWSKDKETSTGHGELKAESTLSSTHAPSTGMYLSESGLYAHSSSKDRPELSATLKD